MSSIFTAILFVGVLTGMLILFIVASILIFTIAFNICDFVEDLYRNLKNWWARR